MSCEQENNCLPCSETPCPEEVCPDKNYSDVNCVDTFPLKCAIWTGEPIECLGIENGDNGDIVISKIMAAVCDSVINSPDNLFRITEDDTTSGYFLDKVVAGTGITITKNNAGGNETVTFSVNSSALVPLVINSTDNTITHTVSGSLNHTADLGIRLSTDVGNALSKRANGLFASDSTKLKVSSTDTTSEFLQQKIIAGGNISIIKLNNGANEVLQISTNSIGLVSVTTLDSDTIDFSGTGTSSNPLYAVARISTNPLNMLSYDSTGLLVLPQETYTVKVSNVDASSGYLEDKIIAGTNITIAQVDLGGGVLAMTISSTETTFTATDSSTIDFSTSGSYGHTLTGSVKVSAVANNIITIAGDGMYVGLPGTGLVKSTAGVISYITDNSANWNTAYALRITTLTTTGNSGPATLISNVLNIPEYTLSGLGGDLQAVLDIGNQAYDQSINLPRGDGTGGVYIDSATSYVTCDDYAITGHRIVVSPSNVGFSKDLGSTFSYLEATVVSASRTWTLPDRSGNVVIAYASLPTYLMSADGLPVLVSTGLSYASGILTNTAPDQTVVLSNGAGISVTGTYPNFTIASTITQYTDAMARAAISLTTTGSSGAATYSSLTGAFNIPNYTLSGLGGVPTSRNITINGTTFDLSADRTWNVGTVTSVGITNGTGISVSGSPITSSGVITITNTAPDQTVVLNNGTGISVTGTYPNFTVTNTAPDQTVALTNNGGVTITGTYPNFGLQVSTNYAPTSGSANYIQNQIASAQSSASYWIDGKGVIGTGTPVQTTIGFTVAKTTASASQTANVEFNIDKSVAGTNLGLFVMASSSHTSGTTSQIQGINSCIGMTGSGGTVTTASGFKTSAAVSAGSVGTYIGYYASVVTATGSGSITTKYSFFGEAGAGIALINDGVTSAGSIISTASYVQGAAQGAGNSYIFRGTNAAGSVDLATLNQSSTGDGAIGLYTSGGTQAYLLNAGGNSYISTGFKLTVGSTTAGPSTFNVVGTAHFDLTETYVSGPSYGAGYTYIPTYSGSLPTSTSFSTIPCEFHPTFSASTTVQDTTQFGSILATTYSKFSGGGGAATVTMNGGNANAVIHATTFDDGTINGTIDRSAGVIINGIGQVSGSTATITRTNHYALLINDITGQFGHGTVTNKFAIYQVGTNDISRFFGPVQNASSSVQFTSDARGKDILGTFGRGLAEIDQISTHIFNYKYDPNKRNVVGLIAQELESIIPEAVSKGNFEFTNATDGEKYMFDDYRMIDQTYLFYTMLNAIKELSAKVKLLEQNQPPQA
jgi:hypothetical protein